MAGCATLDALGINPPMQVTGELSLAQEWQKEVNVRPLPRNMHRVLHKNRRAARTKVYDKYSDCEDAFFVDATGPVHNHATAAVIMRRQQQRMKQSFPAPPAPYRGFVVLGFRVWPDSQLDFVYELQRQHARFAVDAFIVQTHITEDEFTVNIKKCIITGPSPYRVDDTVNKYVRGMRRSVDDLENITRIDDYPSLAISFSLCTRQYTAQTPPARLDRVCVPSAGIPPPPRTSADTCLDSEDWYNGSVSDGQQFVMMCQLSSQDDIMTAYESLHTIQYKYCSIRRVYDQIGMALFDVECEDWENQCNKRPSQVNLTGTARIVGSANYTHELAKVNIIDKHECP
ncbi:hypothetical protein HPB51_001806 [Rhipicephalus microplus]|uniref:Uncharacterized protein n=1 Tax=Rhipicephalus microplus TaxID=6941 RepID=A0A9J6EW13_RHIMP|nr:hypothetical protein HPB51_001806 [Rhipicephalus microplus]